MLGISKHNSGQVIKRLTCPSGEIARCMYGLSKWQAANSKGEWIDTGNNRYRITYFRISLHRTLDIVGYLQTIIWFWESVGNNKLIYILRPHKIADLLSHLTPSVFVSKNDVQHYPVPNSIQTIACFHSGLRDVCNSSNRIKSEWRWTFPCLVLYLLFQLLISLPFLSVVCGRVRPAEHWGPHHKRMGVMDWYQQQLPLSLSRSPDPDK